MRIAVVAPSTPIGPDTADDVLALAARRYPSADIEFHPQCFLQHNHFAGTDAERIEAFLEVANDPRVDAVWFARGGYGACRIAQDVLERIEPAAREKLYLGYSDGGYLLAGLYKSGCRKVAHGPMPRDVHREQGDEAVMRALGWLDASDRSGFEPGLNPGERYAAFNLTVLSQLIGTPLQPDLEGHVLLIEDVSEYMYRIDRALFHITSNAEIRRVAGIRLGRVSEVLVNDPEFGEDEEALAAFWCERAGIAYLGRAEIGHDAGNMIVPFGRLAG